MSILRELALWAGILLLLASSLSVYAGWKQRRKATLASETARSEVAEGQPSEIVRVRGTVVPKTERDTFTSPVKGDRDCILSAWEIEELYDTPTTRSWELAAGGVRSVPFFVADESGELLVDIDDRTVGNETDEVFTPERVLEADGLSVAGLRCEFDSFDAHVGTDYGESPPPRLADFVKSTDGISLDPMAPNLVSDASKRRYYEQTLQRGETISVLGYATARDDSGATSTDRLTVTPSAETPLYVSTTPFDNISRGDGGLLFGLLTGAIGIGLLAVAVL